MENTELSTEQFFEEHGYLYIKDLFSEEERLRLASILFMMKEENSLVYEAVDGGGNKSQFYGNSFGGNDQEFEKSLREVQARIEKEIGIKLIPRNSFGRIYYNGGELNRHKDREGLDYTLSITLMSTLDTDWPLWCIDKKGNEVPIAIKQGDAGLMLGTTMTHWREPLVCGEDQFVAQLFMHWAKA